MDVTVFNIQEKQTWHEIYLLSPCESQDGSSCTTALKQGPLMD
ncbi:unnamed protein product [Periconia digitata]|uniref:Uncharacterized protein n=1 Tax=Periconia digitata TaxID=1303443 RepID=A0A9W4U6R0_9PLEO|nr:unnamed protein product [Periconia digitata]